MELIYINDTYSPMVLEFYKKYGIVRPTLNSIYQIRELIKPSGKEGYGVLLEGLLNPQVPVFHPIMQTKVMVEPSFNLNRFTDLQGNSITREMIQEILQTEKIKS